MGYRDVVLADSPVDYLPMDEGSGTVLEEVISGNTVDINGSGGTDYNWDERMPYLNPPESAYSLNPNNEDSSYYWFTSLGVIPYATGTGTGWTIEFWCKQNSSVLKAPVGLGGDSNIDLYSDASNSFYFFSDNQDATRTSLSSGGYSVGTDWAHVVIVNRSTGRELWVNGAERGSDSKLIEDVEITGIFAKNGGYRWNGAVAHFAGYDYALSQAQIEQHWDSGRSLIDTSTASTATAYSNQRKVDRTIGGNNGNGVLWSMFWNGLSNTTQAMEFWYSTDDGATWTYSGDSASFGFSGTKSTTIPNASFFIDPDDYAHAVYKDRDDGYIYYRRGTPNAARTSWTWSSAVDLAGAKDVWNYPDVVAFRTPGTSPTEWDVAVVVSHATKEQQGYERIHVANNGALTTGNFDGLTEDTGFGLLTGSGSTLPSVSIDFHHTGDGKTVAGGTPHLYVAWSAAATGTDGGIRFKKATYSGGSWTWGTEREIDSGAVLGATVGLNWLNCLFDGTRVVMVGFLDTPNSASRSLMLYERDAADTTTTTHTLIGNSANNEHLFSGSATYDGDSNVYIFGRDYDGSQTHLDYVVWDRASDSIAGSRVEVDAATSSYPNVSAKRGYSNYLIDAVYTDGTSSPYDVKYFSKSVATIPSTPTLVSPVSGTLDRRSDVTFDWTHNSNGGGGQTRYAIVRRRRP